jgi:hypothetical protein
MGDPGYTQGRLSPTPDDQHVRMAVVLKVEEVSNK